MWRFADRRHFERTVDAWFHFAVELFFLPVRLLLHGTEMTADTLKGMHGIAEQSFNEVLDPRRISGGCPAPQEPEFHELEQLRDVSSNLEIDNPKEERKMYVDQDLSGDMVKVVQYSIVSVVSTIADNERIVMGPRLIAFSDDMTPEDFTAWVISKDCEQLEKRQHEGENFPCPDPSDPPCPDPFAPACLGPPNLQQCWDRKYLRVAFQVMGRFSKADINYEQAQANSMATIAEILKYWTCNPKVVQTPPQQPLNSPPQPDESTTGSAPSTGKKG